VAECRPDVIFLDLLLPEMDSLHFIRELRKKPAWLAIPIVLIAPQEFSSTDQERLQGSLEQILHRAAYRPDTLQQELRESLAACTPGHPGRPAGT
jgi:adenylate cyclase